MKRKIKILILNKNLFNKIKKILYNFKNRVFNKKLKLKKIKILNNQKSSISKLKKI